MMEFLYKVRTADGRVLAGVLESEDKRELRKQLHQSGYYVVSLGRYTPSRGFLFFRPKVDLDSLIMFTRQLAAMLESGMRIMNALESIWKGTENRELQIAISRVRSRIAAGQSFANAMEIPEVFPVVYRSLLVVAETGGGLVPVFKKLLQYLENQRDYVNKVKRATLYPVFVIFFAMGVLILMLVFVVPTFEKVFKKINVPLPPITQFVLAASSLLRSFWFWGVAAALVVAAIIIFKIARTDRQVRLFVDRVKLRLPMFGQIFYLASIERFVRTLSLLLGGGLSMLTSLKVTKATLVNMELENGLQKTSDSIVEGTQLSTALSDTKLFPVFLLEMVSLGEQTGTLPVVLERAAEHFYQELDTRIHRFLTLLEPFLIVFIGGIVAFVLYSIYAPIFSLWDKIPNLRS